MKIEQQVRFLQGIVTQQERTEMSYAILQRREANIIVGSREVMILPTTCGHKEAGKLCFL